MRKLLLTVALFTLSGCEVGPDYEALKFDLPEMWSKEEPATAPAEAQATVAPDWWKEFNDPNLTALEEEGLKNSANIALAAARVSQARASLRLSDAELYPMLSLEGGAQRNSLSKEQQGGATNGGKPYNNFSVSAVLDYEIDLWGKLRRGSEAAQASLLSEKANAEAVQLAVTSDIASGYFNLLSLTDQIRITKDTIASRQASYDYQNKHYQAGDIDILTLRRAESELATAQATLPMLEQAQTEQQHALALLLGRSPKEIIETPVKGGRALAEMPVPPAFPAGAPSTLLERRPDIQAAEQQLIASNALIGVAKADYYPTLSLSALIGLASTDIDRLLRSNAKAWNAGASTGMPLLDFGRTEANVEGAEARNQQAFISYQQTVRAAFADVANALSGAETSRKREEAAARQVQANSETARAARLRYNAGYATQLDKLDAERQLFQSQLDLLDAKRARLAATITLYKSLGGGRPTQAIAEPKPPEKKPN